MSTQMTPREVISDNDHEHYASKDEGSDSDSQTDKQSVPDIDVNYSEK